MPEELVTSRPEDKVPLHRNLAPIPDCPVRPAVINGRRGEAVDVRIQTCASAWLRCQQEAEAIIADADGNMIADAVVRNRRINAAYAELWLRNPRFQWAGLAAFASKQVGCGLLHSAQVEEKAAADMRANGGGDSFEWLFKNMWPAAIGAGSGYMRGQLSLGNVTLFLDIYPLHRFYELRGLAGLKGCLPKRADIRGRVKWPVPETLLPFGKPFTQILNGFDKIEANDIQNSVKHLAYHEQVNVLQPVIYDDWKTRLALDGNQFAWVTKLPSGDYSEIQLTLSAQCTAKSKSSTIWFAKSLAAQLYDVAQRMQFVYSAAEQFDKLLHSKARVEVERSIREIHAAGSRP